MGGRVCGRVDEWMDGWVATLMEIWMGEWRGWDRQTDVLAGVWVCGLLTGGWTSFR